MPPERPRHRQKVNRRMDLLEIGYESMEGIHVAQNREQQQKTKVQYHVDKNLPLYTNLSQMNPLHIFTPYLFKEMHFSIILFCIPQYYKLPLPVCFLTRNFYGLHFCSMHVTFRDDLIRFDYYFAVVISDADCKL